MNFKIELPVCPVCGSDVKMFERLKPGEHELYPRSNHHEEVRFKCGALFRRNARVSFVYPEDIYGAWSAWEGQAPCPKAQEVALKLLECERKAREAMKM